MKIVISAGHNPGTDPGAIGQGSQEANENVRIADRVVLLLRSWGIDTDYMPNNVGNLQAEIDWMNARYNETNAYGIQIHRNAGGGTGNEVWTFDYLDQWALATAIAASMNKYTGLRNRGVKSVTTNPLGWIYNVNARTVLVESRFIDVDDISDSEDMEDALSIAAGIANFLKVPVGKTPEEILAQQQATEAARLAAEAKARADEQARLAELARLKAIEEAKAAEVARLKAEADKIAADKAKADADKAVKDAINQENLSILDVILKAIKSIFTAILGKK